MNEHPNNNIVGTINDFSQIDEDRLEILREMHTPLEKLYPDEFTRYLDLFFRYCPRRPFHARTQYGKGFICQNGTKANGETFARPCYPGLIAKMLDYDRWKRITTKESYPDYYWVAMNAGKSSRVAAIDFDNKPNLLGYYRYGPYEHCPIRPLVTITLEHLQAVKRLYDTFPGRVWCISSGTLGLHIWDTFPRPQPIWLIHRMTKPKLDAIGLTGTEIHPMFGRPFRRPFGQDYYMITDDGLLDGWIEQLDFFEHVARPPAFAKIYEALRSLLLREWGSYQGCFGRLVTDEHKAHTDKFFTGKKWVNVPRLQEDLKFLDAWAENGFPTTMPVTVSVAAAPAPAASSSAQAPQGPGLRPHRTKAGSQCDIDLPAVCDGQWVQNCEQWVTHGLPCHDSLFKVVSQLARWFYYVELWAIPKEDRVERIIRLLQDYCFIKGNGFISRLEVGLIQDVQRHVERSVMEGIESMNAQGKSYCANMRQKRNEGDYKRIIYLEPLIAAEAQPGDGGEGNTPSSLVGFNICCTVLPKGITKEDRQRRAEEWVFTPDDTPLPPSLTELIAAYYERHRIGCYKATWKKITHLLNHVHAQGGEARLGVETLAKIGFKRYATRQHVQHLVDAGVLRKTKEYSTVMGVGRGYRLAKKVMEMFQNKVKTKTA